MPPRSTAAPVADWEGVLPHRGLVWKLARRVAAARNLRYLSADDLFQEGLRAAACALPRHDPAKGQVSTWVGQIAHFAMLDLLKTTGHLHISKGAWDYRTEGYIRATRTPVVLDPERPPELREPIPRDPAAVCELREEIETLRDAILDLPARLRFVIVRRVFQKRTLDSIAREIGVSRARVWQLHQRAMQQLTKHLARRRTAVCA